MNPRRAKHSAIKLSSKMIIKYRSDFCSEWLQTVDKLTPLLAESKVADYYNNTCRKLSPKYNLLQEVNERIMGAEES